MKRVKMIFKKKEKKKKEKKEESDGLWFSIIYEDIWIYSN